ncbi:MAG TPA: hypothetical protein VHH36_02580 [Candidatus Thermoplasmatota archaeon]|nr:hypothetical protein [Candidatus Thermoplasmatota archaeon]
MVDGSLIASSIAASAAAGLFLAAGLGLRQRSVSRDATDAAQLMSIWWLGLSLHALAGASIDLLAALETAPARVVLALSYMRIVALAIGLWGLGYHVAYILTGRSRLLFPLAALFAGYYAVLVFLLTLGSPQDVIVDPVPRLAYAAPVVDPRVLGALLAVPPLAAAATYLLLYRQAEHASQRVRLVLVAGATFAWFLAALARDASLSNVWPSILLGLTAAVAVGWAYRPPEWLERLLRASAPSAR